MANGTGITPAVRLKGLSLSKTYALKYWWCSPVPVGNLRSEILMVQSAQNWHRQLRPTVWMVRGIGASLCSEAAGHDATRWLSRGIRATRNLALELFFVGTGALRGCTALQELRHMPRLAGFAGRARGRIAADLGLQLDDVDELVGLAAQLIGDHRRLRREGRDQADRAPPALEPI